LRHDDHKRAAEELEAIVEDEPTNPRAHYSLGALAFDDKQWAKAAEHFSKTILLNPGFEQAYYDLASSQIDLDKPADALETLDRARRLFPANFVMELLSAIALSHEKAFADAIQHFTKAEAIAQATDPKRLNEHFYFQIGAACERQGNYAEAARYFEKSLTLAPDYAEALNYLGYMWAEHGMQLDRARELIEKALKAEPKNAAYLDSMAWVLFKLNQPKEALGYVLKAIELLSAPDTEEKPDPTVYDHLGDIRAALKQMDLAREAWQKSVALEPNPEVRRKLEGR
jgi:tetratricopeptide (TPR) repeat protein